MSRRLTTVTVLLLIAAASVSVAAQNKRTRFDPSGAFWISGEPPAEFSDFSSINLNMRNLKRLPMVMNASIRLSRSGTAPKRRSFWTMA